MSDEELGLDTFTDLIKEYWFICFDITESDCCNLFFHVVDNDYHSFFDHL